MDDIFPLTVIAVIPCLFAPDATSLHRAKRQSPATLRAKEKNAIDELCKGRGDEFFRLSVDGDCKEVYR